MKKHWKKTTKWTTLWSRAQRGLGLLPDKPKQFECRLKDIRHVTQIRFGFANYYDEHEVDIVNIACHWIEKGIAKEVCLDDIHLDKQTTHTTHRILLSDAQDFVLSYEIQEACDSGFDVACYDVFEASVNHIFGLHRIDVVSEKIEDCMVFFGDSIVEMGYYVQALQKQFPTTAMVNLGLSGNRLRKQISYINFNETQNEAILSSVKQLERIITHVPLNKQQFGIAGIHRFEREVNACFNVRFVFVGIGVNDLYQPGTFCARLNERPKLNEMIEGYQHLIDQSKRPILFGSITPFIQNPHYAKQVEDLRCAINQALLQKTNCVNFDACLLDENKNYVTNCMNPDYLHPSVQGGALMAKEILCWL